VDIGLPNGDLPESRVVNALADDGRGGLWIGVSSGLYHRDASGRVERTTTAEGLPTNYVRAILVARDDTVWVGTRRGLCQLVHRQSPRQSIVTRVYAAIDGLPSDEITVLEQTSDGTIWIGTFHGGLAAITDERPDGTAGFRSYTTEHGLSGEDIWALAEDPGHNLWIGTDDAGAMRLAHQGFTTFTRADGLARNQVASLFEDRRGELCAVNSGDPHTVVNHFDGKRFKPVLPRLPSSVTYFGFGWNQIVVQDHARTWWVPTGRGLFRFPACAHVDELARKSPTTVYTTADGLAGNDIFRVFEDGVGDIWIATTRTAATPAAANGLARWQRATGRIERFTEHDGLPPLDAHVPRAFAQDAAGLLWIGWAPAGLTRLARGRFESFSDGRLGSVRDLHVDRSGRLWIATSHGLGRIDTPDAAKPMIRVMTSREGLSADELWSIAEDRQGRLYVGTLRGVDRIDPPTGRVLHYTSEHGLVKGEIETAFADRTGALWFGSREGVSRLVPPTEWSSGVTAVRITGIRVNGVPYPIPILGATTLAAVTLSPDQRDVEIDFAGLTFGAVDRSLYQVKLEGTSGGWSPPTPVRSVNYAHLAPGVYRFAVRAAGDVSGPQPLIASLEFRILRPVWQRWWFLMLAAAGVAAAVHGVYRIRLARMREVERIRQRIAADLHDDIGSNLTRIAVLSEVARTGVVGAGALSDPLRSIAGICRESVEALGDIVWAINPDRDSLQELVRRMRALAGELCATRSIVVRFHAPEGNRSLHLDAELRRHVYLVFKEALNNAVRHSRCTCVEIDLTVADRTLRLRISDDGAGFDAGNRSSGEGVGLEMMSRRARGIGGRLDVASTPTRGTTLILEVPLRRHAGVPAIHPTYSGS
jgi:signal transduction histidine kinase/ligand-binding sensor domain-containing protein